ncbi:MAG: hypothetical protein RL277_2313 [Planctomycetota bacterium]
MGSGWMAHKLQTIDEKAGFPYTPSPRKAAPDPAPKLRPPQAMEFVFVVPRTALFPDFYPHGLMRFDERPGPEASCLSAGAFESTLVREGFFVERPWAERSPAFKQLIPYTIVVCGERVLLTRRTKGGGEARLHDKHSIGIGGHINPIDMETALTRGELRNPLPAGAVREIEEELCVEGRYTLSTVGLINDDSNSVGAVHLGIVHVMRVEGSVEVREKDQLEGRLVTVEELRSLVNSGANVETWSRLLVPHLGELLGAPNRTSIQTHS